MSRAFTGPRAFLSNFHYCTVEIDGIEYPSSEHAFVSRKTLDESERRIIAKIPKAGAVKRYGRHGVQLRPDWDRIRDDEMLLVVRAKFMQNPDLGAALLATGTEELVEVNDWHDNYWGRCDCSDCGWLMWTNKLGIVLMKVRDELRAERAERTRL